MRNRAYFLLWLLVLAGCEQTNNSQSPTMNDDMLESADVQPSQSFRTNSAQSLYTAQLQPTSGTIEIGQLQEWQLLVATADGRVVSAANIEVGGGMKGHGHGLPTQPLVSESTEAGVYRVEGVRFNMSGDWTLSFVISSSFGSDRIDFNLQVDY